MKKYIQILKPAQVLLTGYFLLFAGNIFHYHYFHVHTSACIIQFDSVPEQRQHSGSSDLFNGCYFSQNFSSLHNTLNPERINLIVFNDGLILYPVYLSKFPDFYFQLNSPFRAPPENFNG